MILKDRLKTTTLPPITLSILIWGALFSLAFWLRFPHFTSLAMQFDEVEYAYCVETNQLPHSPYLLFLWMGYLMKPFVSLDWGYSALSTVSSMLSIFFIGSVGRVLTGSRWAGWMTALVWILAPIALRVAGKQEVYAFQFCLLSLSWYLGVCHRSVLGSGMALGAAFATHSGTLFALPGTLVLLHASWFPSRESKPEGQSGTSAGFGDTKVWSRFSLGFAVPIVAALTWILGIWLNYRGGDQLSLLPVYLEGNSPSPDFSLVLPKDETESTIEWIKQLRDNIGDQLERYWEDLADPEVIPRGAILFGFIGLLSVPWRLSRPWWLMPIPYLAYEFAAGWTLDPGIYSVYVLPAIAMSAGLMAFQLFPSHVETYRRNVSALCLLGVLASFLINLPWVQSQAHKRNLEPWRIEGGATLSLARWVRDHTPEDAIVDVPAEWFYCGLGIAYYGERLPMFRDGYILRPEPWRPMYANYRFNHLEKVTDASIDHWIDSGRPLLSFDPNPFTGFGANWGGIDTERLETRPIFWLDRNHTGTSRFWKNPKIQIEIEPWLIDDKERRPHFYIDEYFPTDEMEGSLFRPTLYRICRKSDPLDPPDWVKALMEKVPSEQHGGLPVWKGKGILFSDEASFYSPCEKGKDHAVRARIHTKGQEYAIRCEVRYDGDWIEVGQDVEKYVNDPPDVFTDLYFHIPGKYVDEDNLRVRLSPAIDTDFVNLFQVAVGTVDPVD